MTKHIVPRYKLMLFYNISSQDVDTFYQFVMDEMVPALHEMGLYIFRAFHTIPGPLAEEQYPLRQVEYVAEDLETIQSVLESEKWQELESRLLGHVTNYSRKIVRFRQGFQL
jgi:hypothetical protein